MNTKYRQVAAIILKKETKYLLVKKPRKENAWQFPQGGVDEGETHAEASIRELNEECGSTLKVKLNEKPLGSYSYTFPDGFTRHKKDIIGAEVVFFSGIFEKGSIEIDNNEIIDSMWAHKKEIQEKVSPEYWEIVKNWL